MKEKYAEVLDFDLFEGDFGSSDDKQLTNKNCQSTERT